MTIRGDKATNKSAKYQGDPAHPDQHFPFTIKKLSDKQLEITDLSGLFFGSTVPMTFDKISDDELEQVNLGIINRAMKGG